MPSNKIVILGGGLAGLSAAFHLQQLGLESCVLEKEDEVGGLCRTKRVGKFLFDYDGHLLHFRRRYVFDLVSSLLKDNLAEHKRNAWVYSRGTLTEYPFQANLSTLPHKVAKECLDGFVKARNSSCSYKYGNFLNWIVGTFGMGIAKHFMIPYNSKFWTVHPQEMTCDWVEGFIPQPTLDDLLDGKGKHIGRNMGYNSNFWYPREGGIVQLPLAFQKRITGVFTNCEVCHIDLRKRIVFCANGKQIKYDKLISTIPLPLLSQMINKLPQSVAKALSLLRWNSVFNYNVALPDVDKVNKHWIYFPHKKEVFFRLGFYHNFAADMAPSGYGSIYVEVSYSRQKPLDRSRVVNRIRRDLERVGICGAQKEAAADDVNDIEFGYPIYDENYASARGAIGDYMASNNVFLCGRYGSWRYMSMEDVIADGHDMAQRCQNLS